MTLLLPTSDEKRRINIIGQGLAGSVLAFVLIDRGYDVVVIDDGHKSSSSMVAAGMWNPLSFRKLHESWMAHKLIPAADELYRRMEAKLNVSFFHPLELVRIFADNHSTNEWDERSVHPEVANYISKNDDKESVNDFIQPFGNGIILQAGWLNLPVLLLAVNKWLKDQDRLLISEFDEHKQFELLQNNQIVIHCTGWKIPANCGYNWLPVSPNKGEVLTVNIHGMQSGRMFNFGKFIVPIGAGQYRLGATYELNPLNMDPTPKGERELLHDLRTISKHEVELVDHKVGFRPTVPDRKPVIGFSPDCDHLGLFNGFGSKGVMLVPFFAQHFVEHMCSGSTLMKEVNVQRYHKPK